ncbi:PREDICTED: general odorant-binding protein 56d-like [Dufourea novaeangliae]|uniref:general odorant-binding protein 56d-like n=1 Tax=Dufourea novaeangliae TaxID=178035 RepID=UPI000767B3A5|nr:PREDICTED: general odorant-binding protein 56d-like [Dufourea novaeangliae]
MKAIFVVAALCFVAVQSAVLSDEQKAKLAAHKTHCLAETGVDAQTVEDAKNGNVAENDEKLACFGSCMLKRIGIMNQDGSVNEEITRKRVPASVPKEQVDDLINKCKDTTGANDCDKAAKLIKCFKENKQFTLLH